ncbi:DUF1257 domain-containing protein [Haliangium sp.]|uniref:DUF1257 domain-containing protein n=1 Tax=Haliangium sp. TaxID=2663208 RepID=UPI003D0D4AE6
MSAYMTLATPMIDRECLLLALADLGFGLDVVELHDEPVALVGYQGRARTERAEIVIRRAHVGRASNDIGFERTETGYRAHVSNYDHPRFGRGWLDQLDARYREHDQRKQARLAEAERRRREEERKRLVEAQRRAICAQAKKRGYRVEEIREGNVVRLVLSRRVY